MARGGKGKSRFKVTLNKEVWDAYFEGVVVLAEGTASIGLFGDIATIGALHEFGAPGANIPQRAFIKRALSKARKPIQAAMGEGDIKQAAEIAADAIRKQISTLRSPRLDKETTKDKGSSKPLIDTGRMLAAVDFKLG